MPSLFPNVLCRRLKPITCPVRHISLTGAIEKGIRQGRRDVASHEKKFSGHETGKEKISDTLWQQRGNVKERHETTRYNERTLQHDGRSGRTIGYTTVEEKKPQEALKLRDLSTVEKETGKNTARKHEGFLVADPVSVPYTTAGSEFVYGYSAVLAALKARRRKLYKLYIQRSRHEGKEERHITEKRHGADIRRYARAQGVEIVDVGRSWTSTLAKMTENRPHNGYVLETSPIPTLPSRMLDRVARRDQEGVRVVLDARASEEALSVAMSAFEGGKDSEHITIPSIRSQHRYPFLLLLDGIVDPGNVGAIIRSAYVLGVDAVVILEHGTAPLSPVTVKASAGAAEYLPILKVRSEVDFIKLSKEKGWKFFAAMAPGSEGRHQASLRNKRDVDNAVAGDPLRRHPCVLMLGNEGQGLRRVLYSLADGVTSIEGARGRHRDVDSLNVSVAAALLTQKFFDASSPGGFEAQEQQQQKEPSGVGQDKENELFGTR